jgi:Na+/H+ antiporter NhaC
MGYFEIALIIGIIGIVYAIFSSSKGKSTSQDEIEEISSNKRNYLPIIILLVIITVSTLPFHYYIGGNGFSVFPKNTLTFSNTFITQETIEGIIKRYDEASYLEKQSIRNEPFIRKLFEEKLIVEKK